MMLHNRRVRLHPVPGIQVVDVANAFVRRGVDVATHHADTAPLLRQLRDVVLKI